MIILLAPFTAVHHLIQRHLASNRFSSLKFNIRFYFSSLQLYMISINLALNPRRLYVTKSWVFFYLLLQMYIIYLNINLHQIRFYVTKCWWMILLYIYILFCLTSNTISRPWALTIFRFSFTEYWILILIFEWEEP